MNKPEIDTKYTDFITCPYCGYEDKDSWEYGESGDVECGRCEKMFSFYSETTRNYLSEKDCRLNNQPHDWEFFRELPYHTMEECTKCDQPRFVKRG